MNVCRPLQLLAAFSSSCFFGDRRSEYVVDIVTAGSLLILHHDLLERILAVQKLQGGASAAGKDCKMASNVDPSNEELQNQSECSH